MRFARAMNRAKKNKQFYAHLKNTGWFECDQHIIKIEHKMSKDRKGLRQREREREREGEREGDCPLYKTYFRYTQ